jgi:hypothetical protein
MLTLFVYSGTAKIAVFAVADLAIVCALLFSLIVLIKGEIGVVDCFILPIVLACTVDNVIYFSNAYMTSTSNTRAGRADDSVKSVGLAVVIGKATILGSCGFLLCCSLTCNQQFGFALGLATLADLFTVFTLFVPLLYAWGPTPSANSLAQTLLACFGANKSTLDGERSSGMIKADREAPVPGFHSASSLQEPLIGGGGGGGRSASANHQ